MNSKVTKKLMNFEIFYIITVKLKTKWNTNDTFMF